MCIILLFSPSNNKDSKAHRQYDPQERARMTEADQGMASSSGARPCFLGIINTLDDVNPDS